MQTILVTGANGFIGRHLCPTLAAAGYRVRGTLRRGPEAASDGIEYRISGEVDETTAWGPLLEGVEAVVHTAARVHVVKETEPDPLTAFRRVNVAGTERLARQAVASSVRRFVLLSSVGAAVAERQAAGVSDAPEATPYQVSKWEAEQALARVADRTGLEIVVLRLPMVYGADAPGNFRLLLRAVSGGLPLPFGSIENRRSFLYVGNLASAVLACISRPVAAGRVFTLSDGEDVSTPEFTRRLAAALRRPARLFPCPVFLLRAAGRLLGRESAMEGVTGSLVVDCSEVSDWLDWRPPYGMHQALAETATAVRSTPGPSRL